jgi:hypothetical protein
VPETDVTEHRVRPTPEADLGPEGPILPSIQIASSADRPGNAFVAVPYRGYWFSIDDQDMRSKDLFSFTNLCKIVLTLFMISDTIGACGRMMLGGSLTKASPNYASGLSLECMTVKAPR